jgi:hypothetical protein
MSEKDSLPARLLGAALLLLFFGLWVGVGFKTAFTLTAVIAAALLLILAVVIWGLT